MTENLTENFGLVSWDQVEFKARGGDQKRDDFLRLQSGSNPVRLVTKPYQYVLHKWKEPGDKGYGDKIMCSMFHGSCPLCDKGDAPKQRWYIGLIDRKTQSYKVLDMSPAIFQAIQKLNRNESWGDPGTYDIDIVVDKNAGATGYYCVMPMPKSNLSDKDAELKKGVDQEALKRRCVPPTVDEVVRRMQALRQRKQENGAENRAENSAVNRGEKLDTVPDGGEEYDFPPANLG